MAENNEEKKKNVKKEETKQASEKTVKKEVKKEPAKKQTKKAEEVKKETVKVDEKKKDDTTFKKVVNQNNKEKSNHGLLKAILVLIGILVIIYFIFVMRNYIILNNIYEKAEEYKDLTNYTYQVRGVLGDSSSVYTVTRKDNVIRFETKNENEEDREIIIWKDFSENEGIISFPNQNTAIVDEAQNVMSLVSDLPFEFADANDGIIGISLYTLIYSEEYNGKDCYVLSIGTGYKKWIEKDTGLVVKIESGNNSSTEVLSIETNTVNEIYKPDLTGYEVTNNLVTSNETVE